MLLKQYYLGCLAHASYLVGDERTRQAVVVDPQRDIDQYLADASAGGYRITHVILTHFHADFLAGHIELRNRTGARIVMGARVRIAAGALVLLGTTLGLTVHPVGFGLAAFVGAGLIFAGVTDTCGMGLMLARMPWNRVCSGGTCATPPQQTGVQRSAPAHVVPFARSA